MDLLMQGDLTMQLTILLQPIQASTSSGRDCLFLLQQSIATVPAGTVSLLRRWSSPSRSCHPFCAEHIACWQDVPLP